MPCPLVIRLYCPICGEAHMLSALGVGTSNNPTLELVSEPEDILGHDGQVVGSTENKAICGHCSGIFEIDVMVEVVTPETEQSPEPRLSLVPDPDQSS